jgi:hypothetical protein
MPCFFSPEQVLQLQAGCEEVPRQFRDLQERFYRRKYRTAGSAENWRATADENGHYCFAVAL